jgi:hypothetical protein
MLVVLSQTADANGFASGGARFGPLTPTGFEVHADKAA